MGCGYSTVSLFLASSSRYVTAGIAESVLGAEDSGTSEVRLTHGPLGHGTHPATVVATSSSPTVSAVT